jgi:hypothetical protein
VLRTPRLTPRPSDDEGLYELAELALRGIHPAEQMPFHQPWTDQLPDELLAFDHLGATAARSGAHVDNPASRQVSEKLGYRRDGTGTFARRGKVATKIRLLLEASQFIRPEWTLEVDCLDGCRQLLGAAGRT